MDASLAKDMVRIVYQHRETGVSDWIDCTKQQYDRSRNWPGWETRELQYVLSVPAKMIWGTRFVSVGEAKQATPDQIEYMQRSIGAIGMRKAAAFLRDRVKHLQLPPPEGFANSTPEKERQTACDFLIELAKSLEGTGISSREMGTTQVTES